ncbi:MAG TPA: glycosyltransferase family 9 protein, partial [Alphaproteobacteria bacterium]|nr:glycosyltransferase family 9 protein [Alphaproteobacteria bacterium]
ILVIKLGALGDFIQAMGPMKAIRAHHKNAHITLLTTAPFEGFAKDCGYFDEVWVNQRPKWHDIRGWLGLRKRLNDGSFARVYDLQNNDRSSFYFRLFSPKPEWVGVAKGASHRNISPARTAGHAFDGHVQTLGLAGIQDIEIDRLDWIAADISTFALKPPYVLIVPGSAPDNPGKRWPAQHYADLCVKLALRGFQPVILGTAVEADIAALIESQCPQALNLAGKTNLKQIIALARDAALAIGNDTGPMHMIAPTGCPCISLFSGHSNPKRHYPKGEDVEILYAADLQDLAVERVLESALSKVRGTI